MPAIKSTMKAAVLEKLNEDLVIHDLHIPKLKQGQVLVQVKASGICGKQIGEIAGKYGEDKYLPHLLGHEGGGIVKEIGYGVSQIKVGEHVVMHWRKGKGIEAKPPKYKTSWGDIVGGGYVTTFNEFAVVSENRLTPIAKDIPFEIAALMGCAVTTGFGIVFNEIQLKPYNSIAVVGCGGIGLNIIQAAKSMGVHLIVAVDKVESKLKMAAEFGATMLKHSYNGVPKVDFVVECYDRIFIYDNITHMKFESQGGMTEPNRDIPLYLEEIWRYKRLKIEELITHRFPLHKINEALDIVRSGQAGRCMIIMGEY